MRVKYLRKPEQIGFTTDLGLIAGGTGSQREGEGWERMTIWEAESTHSCSMFVARCHIISWRKRAALPSQVDLKSMAFCTMCA